MTDTMIFEVEAGAGVTIDIQTPLTGPHRPIYSASAPPLETAGRRKMLLAATVVIGAATDEEIQWLFRVKEEQARAGLPPICPDCENTGICEEHPVREAAQVFPNVLAVKVDTSFGVDAPSDPGALIALGYDAGVEMPQVWPPAMLDLPEETDPDDEPTNIVAAGLDLLDRVGWTLCNGDTVRFLDAAAPDGPTIYRMTITKEA